MSASLDRLRALEFGPDITHVMAVVNLSPESRVADSRVGSPAEALERARHYRDLGASIIDLGAQSSHFENTPLTPAEEIERMLPALSLLVDDGFVVSVGSHEHLVNAADRNTDQTSHKGSTGANVTVSVDGSRDEPSKENEGNWNHDYGVDDARNDALPNSGELAGSRNGLV